MKYAIAFATVLFASPAFASDDLQIAADACKDHSRLTNVHPHPNFKDYEYDKGWENCSAIFVSLAKRNADAVAASKLDKVNAVAKTLK